MFRIEIFCDDGKVGHVLRAVTGLIIGHPKAQLVANAKVENGKVKAVTDGSSTSMLAKYLKDNAITQIKAVDIKKWLPQVGKSPNSVSAVVDSAIRHGLLKRKGVGRGTYYIPVMPKE